MGNRKNRRGFTLIEAMVSTALFAMIMLLAVSSLAVLVDANKKTRNSKAAIDNLNVIVDEMAQGLRLGSKYYCSSNASIEMSWSAGANHVGDCLYTNGGGVYLSYRNREGKTAFYRFIETNGKGELYQKVTDKNWSTGYTDDFVGADSYGHRYEKITSNEVDIDSFRFYVSFTTAPISGDSAGQPYAIISIKGTTGGQGQSVTSFGLMTSVSQHLLHDVE